MEKYAEGKAVHPTMSDNVRDGIFCISMIVWNDFLHDARVRKEAETLVLSGYAVCVCALQSEYVNKAKARDPAGFLVLRVPRQNYPFRWVARLIAARKNIRNRNGEDINGRKASQKIDSLPRILGLVFSRASAHVRLIKSLLSTRPSAIHAHDVNVLPTAWIAAKIARVPLVYDAHEISTDREGYKKVRRLVACIEKWLMPCAAASITTTDARAKFFARAYHVQRPLVLQNRPRLLDVERGNRIRDELGLDKDWPIVLYQGGLQQGRGLDRLVKAAAEVSDSYFVFIGGGRLTNGLQEQVHSLGLEDRVRFIPTVPLSELPFYTASADIGVQPIENTCLNHFSTDSNKLFEYVIAGLPVVASSLPEIRKVVRQYDLGVLVPPGDTAALVDALRRLVSDPGLRSRYAANSRSAAQQLNWESQEASLVDLYDRVLGRAGRHSHVGST